METEHKKMWKWRLVLPEKSYSQFEPGHALEIVILEYGQAIREEK